MSPRLVAALMLVSVVGVVATLGWGNVHANADIVWGTRGVRDGDLARPRAIAIDPQGNLFLVDFTARIQRFNLDGVYQGDTWTPPDYRNGRPSGLSIDNAGNLIVCDSHYHTLRIYSIHGDELKTFGGNAGREPGAFGYVSDCVQDEDGFYYVSEFGWNDRITKLDSEGRFVSCWGQSGSGPGEFNRVRALALGGDGLLYLVDACNHRVQVLTREGKYIREFGTPGEGLGELRYPYDLAFDSEGLLYVVERGNNRVQKFTMQGESLGTWGHGGHAPGELADPWAIAVDSRDRVHVVDTENHRVQRVLPSDFTTP